PYHRDGGVGRLTAAAEVARSSMRERARPKLDQVRNRDLTTSVVRPRRDQDRSRERNSDARGCQGKLEFQRDNHSGISSAIRFCRGCSVRSAPIGKFRRQLQGALLWLRDGLWRAHLLHQVIVPFALDLEM